MIAAVVFIGFFLLLFLWPIIKEKKESVLIGIGGVLLVVIAIGIIIAISNGLGLGKPSGKYQNEQANKQYPYNR